MFTNYVSVYNTHPPFTAQMCGEKCGLYTVQDGTVFLCCMCVWCEGDGNAGVRSGGCGCGECIYGWYTWFRCFV